MPNEKTEVNMEKAEITERYKRVMLGESGVGYHEDGFKNVLNSYGTFKDSTEYYEYEEEPAVPDNALSSFYENNGIFAKIIDAPAEEAVKHGFELADIEDEKTKNFYIAALDELDWEETAITCLKWMRLFGGSIAVLLINDGRDLEEPVDWKHIKSIDDIVVYDRSVVTPAYETINKYEDPFKKRGSRLGYPEKFYVSSTRGSFTVHESRCLIFQNGVLPENTPSSVYQMWGVPEYIRIQRAVRDFEVAHGYAPKMLDRSVQAIYKMAGLARELAAEGGEERVLKRLQTIDLSRGLLNSIVLDSEGEEYDFRSFSYTGVSDVINTTCNYLSAVSNIPQTILLGRSPAGMNATGNGDLENYYNYVERIQKRVLKSNIRYLLTVLFQAGKATKEIDEIPAINIEFNSLWSMSETERVALEVQKAQLQSTKAQTATAYVQMQAIDPSEVRKKLADEGEFDVETMLDDLSEEEIENMPQSQQGGGDPMAAMMGMMGGGQDGAPAGQMPPQAGKQGNSPDAAPEATKLPEDMNGEPDKEDAEDVEEDHRTRGVGVMVVKDGRILTGTRMCGKGVGLICGPGGHVEDGEESIIAAMRESKEEFNIVPKDLMFLGTIGGNNGHLPSDVYLCTAYDGTPHCDSDEMGGAIWRNLNDLRSFGDKLFQPFMESLELLTQKAKSGFFENKNSWGE